MPNIITSVDEITPAWLTETLVGSSALVDGHVNSFEIEQNITAPMSNFTCRLKLNYSDDARGTLPTFVFFKNGRMNGEVSFAQHMAPILQRPVAPTCYYASFENELGQSNLIFSDITSSHNISGEKETLSHSYQKKVVAALADIHRQFWNNSELNLQGTIGSIATNIPASLALPRAKDNLGNFLNSNNSVLTQSQKSLIENAITCQPHPAWQKRMDTISNVTVVHGDIKKDNLAFPIENGFLMLLDWSLWHIDLPTYDLAYLLALRTPKTIRQQVELDLLHHYHELLDVKTYSFDNLLDDYRLSILFHTIWPIFWHTFTPRNRWIPLLHNCLDALEDWDCMSLLN